MRNNIFQMGGTQGSIEMSRNTLLLFYKIPPVAFEFDTNQFLKNATRLSIVSSIREELTADQEITMSITTVSTRGAVELVDGEELPSILKAWNIAKDNPIDSVLGILRPNHVVGAWNLTLCTAHWYHTQKLPKKEDQVQRYISNARVSHVVQLSLAKRRLLKTLSLEGKAFIESR